ncbi:YbdD/YjiX family protein [Pengzhenrongella sicca]|uniref:YbdD/YjiX family protein n=1 Tax=Pengzhenrongella sicca TaxID=2819238 RepID=A0A8A4ZBA2_9MICO|nr:YbdD/YjiX family protein [Pengzhenrongella sicca]QTE28691.1 YbdD/YjiX family protein [Pengzhenrongella sicca]
MASPARLGGTVRARLRPAAAASVRALARAAGGVRWYATTLMGDHDYARYVAHLARTHPGTAPETERAYWRSRHDDSTPQARCC